MGFPWLNHPFFHGSIFMGPHIVRNYYEESQSAKPATSKLRKFGSRNPSNFNRHWPSLFYLYSMLCVSINMDYVCIII